MSEDYVVAATFATPIEAELAKNHLESEGITVQISDEDTVGWFWHLGNALGGVKLLVPPSELEKSLTILESVNAIPNATSALGAPADADLYWTCEECGRHVPGELEFCPTCEPADDTRSDVGGPLLGAESSSASDELPAASTGDEMAARALRAAVFGILGCPPVLHIYSLFILIRLAMYSGEVSADGIRKGVTALLIDAVAVLTAIAAIAWYGAV